MRRLPVLADVAAAAEHCSYCPKMCRFTCPVAESTGRESVTPWGIDRVVAAMARGETLTAQEQAPVWACTGCRQCATACLPGVDLPTQVRAARAAAHAPPGADAAAGREVSAPDELRAGATAGATTVIYPGCRSDAGAALARLLAGRVAYDVVAQQSCCGARDADVGRPSDAAARAGTLAARLVAAERIVVADPHCARWLLVDNGDERVVTLPSFLAQVVGGLALRSDPAPATWHDPCWLGRGLTAYDDARSVVATASGAAVVEPEHTRDAAWCAGGGMGYPEADPDGASEIARRRVAELRATGAAVTVTGCPTAAQRLRAAGLDAYDLPEYLVTRLEGA